MHTGSTIPETHHQIQRRVTVKIVKIILSQEYREIMSPKLIFSNEKKEFVQHFRSTFGPKKTHL